MATTSTAERERPAAEYNFVDKAVPEKVFNAEMRRIDYGRDGIEKTLARIEAKIDRESAKNDERFDKVDARFNKIDAKFEAKIQDLRADLNAKIDKIDAKIDKTDAKIDKTDAKIDNLLYWVVGTMIVLTGLFSSIVFAIFKGQ